MQSVYRDADAPQPPLAGIVAEGCVDRFAGRPRDQNPYSSCYAAEHFTAWLAGWDEADSLLELRFADEVRRWPREFREECRPPRLILAFELERRPQALNARDLSEAELRRLIDWITSHDGGRLRLEEWLEWHLVSRGIREAA
jgi:ribosome modulation factor